MGPTTHGRAPGSPGSVGGGDPVARATRRRTTKTSDGSRLLITTISQAQAFAALDRVKAPTPRPPPGAYPSCAVVRRRASGAQVAICRLPNSTWEVRTVLPAPPKKPRARKAR